MTYSTSLSIGKSRYASRGQNAVSYSKERQNSSRLGPVSNAIVLVVLVCLIGLVYLTQVTKTNAFSYEIQELQTKQTALKDEQKDLELTAARLQSIDSESVARASDSLVSVAPSGTIQN
jgi:Tfp pilus assembly protein PilN